MIGYALGKKRIGADVVNEAAADLLTIESRDAATGVAEAPPPVVVESAPRGRRISQFGVVAVVVVAMMIGLLSVGRSLLRRDATAGRRAAQRAAAGGGAAGSAARNREPRAGARPPADAMTEPRAGGGAAAGDAVRDAVAAAPDANGGTAGRESVKARLPDGRRRRTPVAAPRPAVPACADCRGCRAPAAAVRTGAGAPAAGCRSRRRAAAVAEAAAGISRPRRSQPARRRRRRQRRARSAAAAAAAAAPGSRRRRPRRMRRWPAAARRQGWALPTLPAPTAVPIDAPAPETTDDLKLVLPNYQRVMVRPGDSVSQIASAAYGQASPTVLDLMKMANPSIRDIDIIAVGQELRLPQLDEGLAVLQQPDGRYALLLLSTPIEGRARDIGKALRRHGFAARVGAGRFRPRPRRCGA